MDGETGRLARRAMPRRLPPRCSRCLRMPAGPDPGAPRAGGGCCSISPSTRWCGATRRCIAARAALPRNGPCSLGAARAPGAPLRQVVPADRSARARALSPGRGAGQCCAAQSRAPAGTRPARLQCTHDPILERAGLTRCAALPPSLRSTETCRRPCARDIRPMTDALAHRGPDGDGFYHCAFAALGHRRLAIIDRAGGHQPMANEDDSCWIVFNGEIYNHKPLRRELEARGHRFRTRVGHRSDPARLRGIRPGVRRAAERHVRVRHLRHARARGVHRARSARQEAAVLRGVRRRRALRQRDQGAAASPAWDGDARPLGPRRLSVARLLRRAAHGLPPRQQARARALAADRQRPRSRRASTGTSPSSTPTPGPTSRCCASSRRCSRDAVACRLESEVPLGAFLSGGIDSGLVVSCMAEAPGRRRGHDVGRLRRARAQRARGGGADRDALRDPPLPDAARAAARGGLRHARAMRSTSRSPTRRRSRPTTCRRRRGRTSRWRSPATAATKRSAATISATTCTRSRRATGRSCREPPAAPLLGWLGRHWPRSRAVPRALRAGNVLENLGLAARGRVLRRPLLREAVGRARAARPRRRRDRPDEPGLRRGDGAVSRDAPRRARSSARSTPT